MKKLISLLFLFLSITCFSQFSKTHYIPPLSNSPSQAPQGQYMYISSPSETPINFVIKQMGGSNISGTVSRDAPYTLNIGSGYNTQLLIDDSNVSSIMSNKGYVVEAEDLIYVTVRLTSTEFNYQAGGLVSKGLAALGNRFRIGAFINTGALNFSDNHYTFATILATENNTTVSFDDIKPNVELINNAAAGSTPSSIVLNSGQSYAIAVKGPTEANRDGLIGAVIKSDKPIVVNCGSFAGSNGNTGNLDLGFDQVVSAERTGTEYIFVRGIGPDNIERPIIVGDFEDPFDPLNPLAPPAKTDVFLNGSTTPFISLIHGEYVALDGSQYSPEGNLYVRTSHNVFAYQGIGGTAPNANSTGQPNQNMCFVPPLSCQTPKIINNIPLISKVGNLDFPATICLVTKVGAVLTFIVNGQPRTVTDLSAQATGPNPVVGNPDYVTYTFKNLAGNVSVFSTKQVYLSYYGTNDNATYGGYYSGFTFKPEIAFGKVDLTAKNCLPNVKLSVNTLSAFDDFKWYFNYSTTAIAGATSNEYVPQQPGFYKVTATITECGITLDSDQIPVSACPSDYDNDGVNDNFDLDIDGDAISNCQESYGNKSLDLSVTSTGIIQAGTYTNSFTKSNTGSGAQTAIPFAGDSIGNFTTSTAVGKGNSTTETFNFPITKPISISLEYADVVASNSDLVSADGDFKIEVPVDKTITVLNPTDQLLIDTNFDGNYDSGVTNFSSFQVRFRLKSGTPLAAGTGTFKFVTSLVNKLSITHTNLSDQNGNNASFKLIATCVPKDTDGDGIEDQLDADSDNDAIPDNIEAIGSGFVVLPFADANNNGFNDANEPITAPKDTDGDGVFDYLDLDSDNDGIYDLVESVANVAVSNLIDGNNNGIIEGNPAAFGSNGLANSLETTPDSGILASLISDLDTDGIPNYLDLDSDGDECNDVTEAGFLDQNLDGLLGNTPISVNTDGLVTPVTNGYTAPNSNYNTNGLITITTQPLPQTSCEAESASFTIVTTNAVNGYQWQESTDGGITYNNITDVGIYSGTATATLTLTGVPTAAPARKYRVFLTKNGNTCGKNSDGGVLTVLPRPNPVPVSTLVQCDDDLNGFADFNLKEKEPLISTNFASETFTYFKNEIAAQSNDLNGLNFIPNPTVYNNVNGNTVWVRVVNGDNCFNTARLNLIVSTTKIQPTPSWNYYKCDDDTDGIINFDFHLVTTDISQNILPPTSSYTIKYYKDEADANAETDSNGISLEISQNQADPINVYNYRNITRDQQFIWVRIDGTADNSCYDLGPFINLTVEALPRAKPSTLDSCDDDPTVAGLIHNFDTSTVEAMILNGQSLNDVKIEYTDANNTVYTQLPSPFPSGNQEIKIKVTNKRTGNQAGVTTSTDGPCSAETILYLKVDAKPFVGDPMYKIECDENADDNEVTFSFDTSTYLTDIVGTQTGFEVKYFDENNVQLIGTVPNSLPNPFKTETQRVKVIIENPLNTICNVETFIQFTVNPLPDIKLSDDEIICNGKINNSVKLNAGLQSGVFSDYSYVWKRNNTVINGAVDYYYTANVDGIYTTLVKNYFTGCERTRTNNVTFSEKATKIDVIIVDLVDDATVEIVPSGDGTYEFSIDEPNGPFQSSAFFQDVNPGFHTVYVNDIGRCGTVEKLIAVLGAPKYFTPNGDGFNDTWKVLGINSVFYKNSRMFIFDRFGKVLKEITGRNDEGWDGTYNGQPLPSDDYWFVLNVDDGRTAKGHFALKR